MLYLTSDTDLPQWSGKGSVVLEPVEWPVHDYSGKSYDDSVYLSFEKSESSQQGMAVSPSYFTMEAFVTSSIWPRGKKREAFIWVLVRETEQMPIPTM